MEEQKLIGVHIEKDERGKSCQLISLISRKFMLKKRKKKVVYPLTWKTIAAERNHWGQIEFVKKPIQQAAEFIRMNEKEIKHKELYWHYFSK